MISRTSVASGEEGVAQIIQTLNALKDQYGACPGVRSAALAIAAGKKNHDQAGHVNRLAGFVRNALVYVADPINAEYVQTPDVLLLQINKKGRAFGDCDDHCLLFASLCESLGIPCTIAGVISSQGSTFDHVICIAHLETGDLRFDLCAKGDEQPAYDSFLVR